MRFRLEKGPKKRLQNLYKLHKNLGTSWQVQTKLFFEHSTLHGVRYIAEYGRPFLERFMWFSCVGIGAVATAVIIVSLWDKFQTNPTITGLDTDFHNWKVPFPAITVCQEKPYNLSRIEEYFEDKYSDPSLGYSVGLLTELTKLSFDSIRELTFKIKPSASNTFDLKEVAFELMNRCEEIFESCEFKSYKSNCCEDFFPVFTEKGFCYTFNSRHYEKKLPWNDTVVPDFQMRYIKETDLAWSLKFTVKDTSVNMPIYILNSDEQAGLDIQPQHIWDYKINKISFSVKQTYTTEDTKQLSIKQRHCVFSDELKLQTDNIYTYTACTRQCRMDNSMRLCKCVPFFYPQIGGYKHCSLLQLSCIWENLDSIKSVDRCFCNLGCSNTVYEVEKLTEATGDSGRNELEARFVSWPMVRYKREVLFGWVDLLVSFGGIAGLFLGFSLLSGVEILYYFTIRACCMVVREKRELEKIQFEQKTKLPEDYDLSLMPYCCFDPFPGNGINQVAKSYYHENLYQNKIAPLGKGKWNPSEKILPPFGIEFIN
ncbi:sodium channel protein Nach [Tribolium castaneum]|uniref:Sodium channel protein Nach-like Protein n=1 Tax=Tribolium castaneum TaxID=7070 RepID=D6X1W4_TRICA|nr:PREDICTED: sodium channel protein Nach [Tribolium castaneum]EFA10172.2 Sodium channel protein Nach-like Protein [Tribolium castaneum]|eukprot:XP_969496.1 PREDICTED: sodium channel protein Nach [Tribolium castaneum]